MMKKESKLINRVLDWWSETGKDVFTFLSGLLILVMIIFTPLVLLIFIDGDNDSMDYCDRQCNNCLGYEDCKECIEDCERYQELGRDII